MHLLVVVGLNINRRLSLDQRKQQLRSSVALPLFGDPGRSLFIFCFLEGGEQMTRSNSVQFRWYRMRITTLALPLCRPSFILTHCSAITTTTQKPSVICLCDVIVLFSRTLHSCDDVLNSSLIVVNVKLVVSIDGATFDPNSNIGGLL